ncbi:Nif3-like dinuclear metal center hexameric protein [bacterium]|nr:Nif3-like dinuclear metal center hexameric protein [bacterium]
MPGRLDAEPLRAAHAADEGFPLVICHGFTFWNHRDEIPPDNRLMREKLQFIRDHELAILRNHDCWDRWPGIGIPFAWARALGFENEPSRVSASRYQHRYDIPPISLDRLAARIARRCQSLGERAVQVIGDGDARVSRIGVGTGAVCRIEEFLQLECDCSIVCDDGARYWDQIQLAADMDHPVVRVNHGTSEEPGMATLAGYINANLPGLSARHLSQGCRYRLVGGRS